MPKRQNLWYSLLWLFLGVLLLRLSFLIEQKAPAEIVLVAGVILVLVALIVFWKNFRE
ncbi:MAG TPA: hypothetical protein VHE59_19570 [Mucilaginibacter sp.]|nr:hypothetical protein [Bacteroidota bacterium]HVS94250.1 hypothetical protein [Mucilaginibacter sp.]